MNQSPINAMIGEMPSVTAKTLNISASSRAERSHGMTCCYQMGGHEEMKGFAQEINPVNSVSAIVP